MECPICLRSMDSDEVELLARHLGERHDFESSDAGRTARSVQQWAMYDAAQARDDKVSLAAGRGDDSGHDDRLVADRVMTGGGDLSGVVDLYPAALAGSRISLEP